MAPRQLQVTCSCGRTIPVDSPNVPKVDCVCGRSVPVGDSPWPLPRETGESDTGGNQSAGGARRLAGIVLATLLALLVASLVVVRTIVPPREFAENEGDRQAVPSSPTAPSTTPPAEDEAPPPVKVADPEATFSEFCSTCHLLPTPDVEPKRLWPDKVRQMYRYARGPRPQPPEKIPPIEAAIDYWASRAPEQLVLPPNALGSPRSPLTFQPHHIVLEALPGIAAVSCVHFVELEPSDGPQLLISDMGQGLVVLWKPHQSQEPARVLAHIPHPSRTQVVDLDGDGLRDVLVANLGDFWPVDTDKGSVVWLRNRGNEQYEAVTLVDGLGRVNEAHAADFDADGDLDIVVAVFGNLTTGRLLYLENVADGDPQPVFEPLSLEDHPGTSDVPVVDLDGDGNLDFLVLQSQEREQVVAYLNRGWGSFRTRVVYRAPHPRWGSTGIRLVDLDGDGDIDVLLNHGDAFESPPVARPYHGISWLENCGEFPFRYHRLTHMPAAQSSLPGDLDGDGDVDVVAGAFMPMFNPRWPDAEQLDSVVWFEQVSPGRFVRYSLQTRTPFHACGDLGDWDGDGDLDIVLGNFFLFPDEDLPTNACLTVLENRSIAAEPASDR